MVDSIIITPGYIIRKQPYKERGFMIDLLTEKLGRVKLFLQQGRAQKRYSANLELFSRSEWTLKPGRTFFFADAIDLEESIRLGGKLIWSGYYLNELLLRLFPEYQEDEGLYAAYELALKALDSNYRIEPALRFFERLLLMHLGIFPDLSSDHEDQMIESHRTYFLRRDEGISRYPRHDALPLPGGFIQKIEADLPNFNLNTEEARAYKMMMRYLYEPLLQGRPLQSRVWLQKLYYPHKS